MTATADTTIESAVPGWEAILDPGETIVWQGRPDPGFHLSAQDFFAAGFGLAFAGFAVFWMIVASGAGGALWMFGLIHFTVGVALFWRSVHGDTTRRRHSWYTLTDRRAFIATDLPFRGKTLKHYPITPDSPVSHIPGELATIHFARERRSTDKGRRYWANIGFERIAEGDRVIALIRDAQRKGDAA